MKAIFMALALTIILSACSKKDVTNEGNKKLNDFIELEGTSVQKNAYTTLTPAEKADLWLMRFNSILEKKGLTQEQTNVLKSGKKFLTESNFTKNSKMTDSDEFIIWKHKAAEVFSQEEQYLYFVTFNDLNREDEVIGELDGKNDCSCSKKSDFCNALTPKGSDYYYHCDAGAKCEIVKSDCGFLWSYDCVDKCKIHSIFN